MSEKMKLALLFGGRSSEHEVSIMSGRSVYQAIDKDKYEVYPIAITKEGRWLTPEISLQVMEDGKITTESEQVIFIPEPGNCHLKGSQGNLDLQIYIDLIFPVLHGPFGEDGTIQGMFELAGIPYVGAGVASSAVGMDKGMMKSLFQVNGLPQGRYKIVTRFALDDNMEQVVQELEDYFGYPCFVKPANLGSSVGVSKVHNREAFPEALSKAAEHDRKIIVEEFIDGRELEVSVLGNDVVEASVAGEIVPAKEFYDYEAKYVTNDSELLIPAPIDAEMMTAIRELAIRAYKAVDAQGFSRVDFFYEKGTGRILVNEINTIPGFTRVSMYPKLWEATGLPYTQLVDRLIQLALERHADMRRNKF